MVNIVIVGTSGVGKSHLEQELKANPAFIPLPKYTDRPLRPTELGSKDIISLSSDEFTRAEDAGEFFFRLDYRNNRYGWKNSDIDKIKSEGKNATLGITLESLKLFLESTTQFIPIFLKISEENISLLADRMKKRGDNDEDIEKRIELAKEETKKFGDDYCKMVTDNNGKIFEILSDDTMYDEVIPFINQLTITN